MLTVIIWDYSTKILDGLYIYLHVAFLYVLCTRLKYGLPIRRDSAYVVASHGQAVGDHYSRILAYGHLFGNLRI